MADNYLEKKMQDHAAGGFKPFHAPESTLPYEATVVLAEADDVPLEVGFACAIRVLAEAGFKVALTVKQPGSATQCQKAAQQTGSRYLPFERTQALEYIRRTWGEPTLLLRQGGEQQEDAEYELWQALATKAHSQKFTIRKIAES